MLLQIVAAFFDFYFEESVMQIFTLFDIRRLLYLADNLLQVDNYLVKAYDYCWQRNVSTRIIFIVLTFQLR